MSRLRRPFLYDRYIFVTVDLQVDVAQGSLSSPAAFPEAWAFSAPPKARRGGKAATLEGERCATSLWRGRRRTAEPVRADN